MRASSLSAAAVLAFILVPLTSHAAVLNVPSQYSTIQAAVNAAAPGDTVRVSPMLGGLPYNENVVIDKESLTLQGVNNPILDGTGLTTLDPLFGIIVGNNGITVVADGVTVCGLTVQNYNYPTANNLQAAAGVAVAQQESSSIVNNTLRLNARGILIDGLANETISQTHAIRNNRVIGNGSSGTWVRSVNGSVVVEDNTFQGNVEAGFEVSGSTGLVVRRNTIAENGTVLGGFAPALSIQSNLNSTGDVSASKSEFYGNTIVNNGGLGVFVADSIGQRVFNNTISGNLGGILLSGSGVCRIKNNVVLANIGDGIVLEFSTINCNVEDNHVMNNLGGGICLFQFFGGDTINNNISENVALGNTLPDGQDQSGLTALTVLNRWRGNMLGTSDPIGLR